MNTPLSLDQAKDLVAKELGFEHDEDFGSWVSEQNDSEYQVESFMEKVAILFADSQKQHAFNQGCEAQKEKFNAVRATLANHYPSGHILIEWDKAANAPNAEYKD